jgi:outer membrane usher protein
MRCHDSKRKPFRPVRFVAAILLAWVIMPPVAKADDQPLLLEVLINGHSTDKIGEFTMRNGKLMARPDELRDLGLRVPVSLIAKKRANRTPKPDDLIEVSRLPGLTWRIDQTSQQLYVTVAMGRLLPTELHADRREESVGRRVLESGTGATLNYDIVSNFANGQGGASGSLDVRAFSPFGVISSNWLGYVGATSGGTGTNTTVRLDSTYEFADVNTLRRYSIGDFITTGLSWTRPVHLTGVQVRSDFGTRPDLVTFPLPSVRGTAAVPSTLDVLADGNQVLAQQIAPGPFEIPQLPVVMGAGTISLSVTNALGQQVTVNQPFYASAALLAPKLQTFAVQTGVVRLNWGSVSNEFGKVAGAAIYRRGLTSKFTIEGSVEGTPGASTAGVGGLLQIGTLGVVNVSTAFSSGAGHTGEQFSLGAQRIGKVFSLGASAVVASKNYTDVAGLNGSPVPKTQLNANTGLSLKRYGTFGIAYGELNQAGYVHPISGLATPEQKSRVFSANYSVQVHHVAFYANEFRNFAGAGSSNGFQAGLTIPFGRRSSANVSASSDGSGQVQVQKSASTIGEWGYQGYVSAGGASHDFAQLQYKSPVALMTAGVDQSGGQVTVRLENQGALSFVDKGLFPSNTIYDSFAIVDTGPMAHVHVLQENREVGKTNSSGKLLVPDVRSFDLNHIAIVSTDIPMDATIDDASRTFRPRDLSGVVVKFPIKISHGALLSLVDEAGVVLPVGSIARLRATSIVVPVGYDGEAYVQDLSAHNEVDAELPDGQRCTVTFNYQPTPGEIPVVGPLHCVEQRP